MSKQLTLSASVAVLAMAAFALATSVGERQSGQLAHTSAAAPLLELSAVR